MAVVLPPGDAHALAEGIQTLLADDVLRQRLARNAVDDVKNRFNLARQVEIYLDWYREIVQKTRRLAVS